LTEVRRTGKKGGGQSLVIKKPIPEIVEAQDAGALNSARGGKKARFIKEKKVRARKLAIANKASIPPTSEGKSEKKSNLGGGGPPL